MSKMKGAQKQLNSFLPYFEKLESLLLNLLSNMPEFKNPFLENRQKKQKTALCLFTSDTGLCGVYNHNIINQTENLLNKYGRDKITLIAVGKKGVTYFKKRGFDIPHVYADLHGRYTKELADDLLKTLTELFMSRQADEIYTAYTHSESASRHVPVIEKFLPLTIPEKKDRGSEFIFEPDIATILNKLIPEYLSNKIKYIFLDTFLSEHSTRLMAMSQATDNAQELCDSLVLLRNKVRQANITNELLDIISSQEALK